MTSLVDRKNICGKTIVLIDIFLFDRTLRYISNDQYNIMIGKNK